MSREIQKNKVEYPEEEILKRLVDIHAKGTAFFVFDTTSKEGYGYEFNLNPVVLGYLPGILCNGLIPDNHIAYNEEADGPVPSRSAAEYVKKFRQDYASALSKERREHAHYATHMRNRSLFRMVRSGLKAGRVYFNVIGRMRDLDEKDPTKSMANSYYVDKVRPGPKLILQFDVRRSRYLTSSFPSVKRNAYTGNSKFLAYKAKAFDPHASSPAYKEKPYSRKVLSNHGYTSHRRVRPDDFLALVLFDALPEDISQVARILEDVRDAFPGKELFLYEGETGNLLWPKEVPYAEIRKKFQTNDRGKKVD